MVREDEQHVILRAESQEMGPQQRAPRQIEPVAAEIGHAPPHLALRRPFHRHDLERHRDTRRDHLYGLAATGADRGAQGLVSRDQRIERALQQRHVETATQPQRQPHRVGGTRALELIEEPEPLLREGDRTLLRPRQARGRTRGGTVRLAVSVHRRKAAAAPRRSGRARPRSGA